MQLICLSKIGGIGGSIKNSPDDFIVEEICEDGTVLELNKKIEKNGEGRFVHFVLQKCGWSTPDAIKAIAKKLRISFKRFNAAGMKDKNATTTQLVSVFALTPQQIMNIKIKGIQINGAWSAKEKVKLGALLGNRFTVKVKDPTENASEIVEKIYSELDGKIPNYFGEQRFGTSRCNTHLVGEKIIKGNFEEAALIYLTDSGSEENAEIRAARAELKQTRDFAAALKTFPKNLHLERSMLAHLAAYPRDYVNAFRKLPRNILLMFVHAFQSYLFNVALAQRIAEGELIAEEGEYFCGENLYGFPDINSKIENGFLVGKIIGYETQLNEREKNLLGKFGIKKDDFKIKSMPEISSKGTYRPLLVPLKDFSFYDNTFKFSLPSGSYATVALREFLSVKK